MDYPSAIEYLYGLQRFGIKLGLANITCLLEALGSPHRKLRCIHVAGTNGKGSTSAMIEAIMRNAGYRTGLYTSPHLSDFSERIQICRRPISHRRVAELVATIRKLCERKSLNSITFFEFTTALAFLYFQQEKVDPVIVETGLGGRWDATNVIDPLVSVVTTISRDHQQYLGKKLCDIAGEKAGIIKPGRPVVTGRFRKNIRDVFKSTCRKSGSDLYSLGKEIQVRPKPYPYFTYQGIQWSMDGLRCGLAGEHQIQNAGISIATVELLVNAGYRIQEMHVRKGIRTTHWPARFETIMRDPHVIIDGAHNVEACRVLRKTLDLEFPSSRRVMVLGMMQDKDIPGMLNILTEGAYATIVCRPEMNRSADRALFQKFIAFSTRKRVFWIDTVSEAFSKALELASPDDVVCIAGSLFLAGEIRDIITGRNRKNSGRIGM